MLIHGFTPEEWQQFSKAERRILALILDMNYEREKICEVLEIKDVTLRWHIASIRRKQSQFRAIRSQLGIQGDLEKSKALHAYDEEAKKILEDTTLSYVSRNKSGREVLVRRNVNSNLTMKELIEPLDGPPLFSQVDRDVSGLQTIKNPTI